MGRREPGIRSNLKKEREAFVDAAASMIRRSSEEGQLTSELEIVHRLIDQYLTPSGAGDPDPKKAAEGILTEAVDGNEDLRELANRDGSRHFYSSLFMTESYARILHQRQSNHLQLIAETIRQNSAVYPRPVPLDMFTQPPFELTLEEVSSDLEQMAAQEEYGDIRRTTTSASREFVYSTLHLEPEHASMLAEWLDVGQLDNP